MTLHQRESTPRSRPLPRLMSLAGGHRRGPGRPRLCPPGPCGSLWPSGVRPHLAAPRPTALAPLCRFTDEDPGLGDTQHGLQATSCGDWAVHPTSSPGGSGRTGCPTSLQQGSAIRARLTLGLASRGSPGPLPPVPATHAGLHRRKHLFILALRASISDSYPQWHFTLDKGGLCGATRTPGKTPVAPTFSRELGKSLFGNRTKHTSQRVPAATWPHTKVPRILPAPPASLQDKLAFNERKSSVQGKDVAAGETVFSGAGPSF